jgi:DNA-binding CsgD family transcriptional regulator
VGGPAERRRPVLAVLTSAGVDAVTTSPVDHALGARRGRGCAVLVDDVTVPSVGGPPVRDPAVRDPGGRLRLDVAVADMYGDLRVDPLLRRLLVCTRCLLGTVAGTVSVVDGARSRCTTIVDDGRPGRLGQSLPLGEGATGPVFAPRAPVVIDDWARAHLPGVDLPPTHPTHQGSAAAAPLWWQGEVIGVNVAFAGRPRRFTATELDDLELLTQSAVPALVRAAGDDPALVGLLGTRASGTGPPVPGAACPLTQREEQVLRLLVDGLSDREVATRLVISPKTVQKHVGAVLRKSGTTSRTAAVVRALKRGWVS